MAMDDDDLDEYDADVFFEGQLSPARLRKVWDHRRNNTASTHHDRAQLMTLTNSFSTSSIERFRTQFGIWCRTNLEEIERQLLRCFLSGHATDLLALARDRLMQMYLAENGSDAIATKLSDLKTETDTAEVIAALLDGEAAAKGIGVKIHDASGLKPGRTGSDKDIRDAMRVTLASPKMLPGPQTTGEVDELAAQLYATTPWMQKVVEFWWSSMQDSLDERGVASLPPTLIVGPQGCGKTHLAEELARVVGRHWRRLDGATMTSSFAIAGGDFLWRNSHASEPIRLIAETGTANPIIIFDEAEKATSSTGGDARKALLPLLQRSTAASYQDAYLQSAINLSFVDWILLANSTHGLPGPLLDRVTVFDVGYPSGAHLRNLIERQLAEFETDSAVIDRIQAEFEAGRLTLRSLDRIKAHVRQIMRRPMLN